MALLPVQSPAAAGTVLSLVAPTVTTGDTYVLNGTEIIVIDNASGSAIDVTFKQKRACNHGYSTPTHDIVQSVGIGAREMFPCPNPLFFADDSGLGQFICSAVGSVTVGVVRR